ncbi:MFS transporter [Carnimonas bestiolae]|uniref:MFS transporter n=1 Tax=Carnimonas bestiolae TaxID=3402172 RepID=UPI003EDC9D55
MIASTPRVTATHPSLPAVFLLGICALLNLYSPQPILPALAHWGGVTVGSAGLTISATTLGVALTAPLAGSLSDRLGRKRLIVWAITLMVACTLCCVLSTSFHQLLLWRFLQGLTIPFVFAVTLAYISEESSAGSRALVNSVYVAGTAFGGFLGRFVAGTTLEVVANWRYTFVALAVVELVVLCGTLFLLKKEANFTPSRSLLAGISGAWRHLGDMRLLLSFGVGFLLLFQQVGSFTYASIALLHAPYNLPPPAVGAVFLVFLLPVITTPLAGKINAAKGPLFTYLLFSTAGAAGLAITLLGNVWCVLVGMALSCISIFAGQSASTSFISSHCQHDRSSAIGLYLSGYYLGGAAGAIVPARLYAHSGWPGCVVLLVALAAVSCVFACIAWRK